MDERKLLAEAEEIIGEWLKKAEPNYYRGGERCKHCGFLVRYRHTDDCLYKRSWDWRENRLRRNAALQLKIKQME